MKSSPKRILIIDDDLDIQDIFCEVLSSEGYETRATGDGQDALAWLLACSEAELPDLIILDSNMPKMNGVEFLKAIQETNADQLKRISILMSSGDSPEDQPQMPGLMIQHIQKPVEFDTLVDSVAKVLNQ